MIGCAVNGVEIGSIEKMVDHGRKLQEHRATITANAIRKAISAARGTK